MSFVGDYIKDGVLLAFGDGRKRGVKEARVRQRARIAQATDEQLEELARFLSENGDFEEELAGLKKDQENFRREMG